MRRNVQLNYSEGSKIFLYTHWGAETLKEAVKAALTRGRDRWSDEAYLARIIFSEMIRDEVLDTTGYGIAPWPFDPEYPTITVDMETKTVDGVPFDSFIAGDYTHELLG